MVQIHSPRPTIVREEFQRHVAAQAGVFGFVDDIHAAAAQLLDDAVVRNGLPDERIGLRHNAVILGCALRLSQRIEVIWRHNRH